MSKMMNPQMIKQMGGRWAVGLGPRSVVWRRKVMLTPPPGMGALQNMMRQMQSGGGMGGMNMADLMSQFGGQ